MDWQLLISDLSKRGLSQSQIAFACDCGQATISALSKESKRGPSFDLGNSLVKLSRASDREIARIRTAYAASVTAKA